MSTVPATGAYDNSGWIRDLVYLAFPEGGARERVLFDLVKQFAKMDPEDPEWLRYKLSIVECQALENVARSLNDAAAEQARLRSVTREVANYAATQLKGTSLHDSIAGDAVLKSYSEETRQQFGGVIRTIIESSLTQALAISQEQMNGWLRGALDEAIRNAQDALAAVTLDFRVKLLGAWGYLLWGVFAGGILSGAGLLFLGYWFGKHI
jgi:citrate lyase gamma subunit